MKIKKLKPPKKATQVMGAALAITMLLASVFFAGAHYEKVHSFRPPANELCRDAMKAQTRQLKANLDAQFGAPIPGGTPSAVDVANLQKQCDENIDRYEVSMK